MTNKKVRKWASLFLAIGFFVAGWWLHSHYWPVSKGKPVSLFWTRDNPDTCTGDVQNAVVRFEKIYRFMDAYRKKHNELPVPGVLMQGELDGNKYLTEAEDFFLPDYKCSEGYDKNRKNSPFEFSYWTNRPDGAQKPAFPAKNQRDIWMVCQEYSKMNRSSRVGIVNRMLFHRVKDEPSGFDVVLWSDGVIEKVPPQKRIAFQSGSEYIETYAGQAGLKGKAVATFAQLTSQKSVRGN